MIVLVFSQDGPVKMGTHLLMAKQLWMKYTFNVISTRKVTGILSSFGPLKRQVGTGLPQKSLYKKLWKMLGSDQHQPVFKLEQ